MDLQIFKVNKTKYVSSTTWTPDEDRLLIESYQKIKERKRWKTISLLIGNNKTPNQCYRRYKTINPTLKKGRWTEEEDEKLLKLIEEFGKNWCMFAKIFKNRSSNQIKSRYEEYLKNDLNKTKFTKDEDDLIIQLYEKYKSKWSKFKKEMPLRSQKRIKFRCQYLIRQANYNLFYKDIISATANNKLSKKNIGNLYFINNKNSIIEKNPEKAILNENKENSIYINFQNENSAGNTLRLINKDNNPYHNN